MAHSDPDRVDERLERRRKRAKEHEKRAHYHEEEAVEYCRRRAAQYQELSHDYLERARHYDARAEEYEALARQYDNEARELVRAANVARAVTASAQGSLNRVGGGRVVLRPVASIPPTDESPVDTAGVDKSPLLGG